MSDKEHKTNAKQMNMQKRSYVTKAERIKEANLNAYLKLASQESDRKNGDDSSIFILGYN